MLFARIHSNVSIYGMNMSARKFCPFPVSSINSQFIDNTNKNTHE